MSLHGIIVPDKLDGNKLLSCNIHSSHYAREHALAEVGLHVIPAIEQLTQDDFVVTFRIVPIVKHTDIQGPSSWDGHRNRGFIQI